MKDYYQLFSISMDSTSDQIKIAYRRLAKQYHPDSNQGNKEYEEKLKEILEAYEILRNPEKRQHYDRRLRTHKNQQSANASKQNYGQAFNSKQENKTSSESDTSKKSHTSDWRNSQHQEYTHSRNYDEQSTGRPKNSAYTRAHGAGSEFASRKTEEKNGNGYLLIPVAVFLIAIIALAFHSANNKSGMQTNYYGELDTTTAQPVSMERIPDSLSFAFYRRYAGMVGKDTVVINLHFSDSLLYGNCEFSDGRIYHLYPNWDTSSSNRSYYLRAVAAFMEKPGEDRLQFRFYGDTLAGLWRVLGKDEVVRCNESYPLQTYSLTPEIYKDSFIIRKSGKSSEAVVSLSALSLAYAYQKNKMTILNELNHGVFGCERDSELSECMKHMADKFFREYQEDMSSISPEDIGSWSTNHSLTVRTFIAFNSHNIVSIEFLQSVYLGGAHDLYGSTYYILDMEENRKVSLEDVMEVDTAMICKMIEGEIRKMFKLSNDAVLSDALLVDTIPFTNNFYLCGRGVVFSYSPYEIASFSNGQVEVLLSYRKLSAVLNPFFRKRFLSSSYRIID